MKSFIQFLESYHTISSGEAQVISSFFKPRTYEEGEYLFTGDKVCKEMFFISSGIVRTVALNEKGIDVTHFFIKENRFCTILQSFNDEVIAEDSIQACCTTDVLMISKQKLFELYHTLPFIKELIEKINRQHLLEKIRIKNLYSGEDSVNRYKLFLTQQPDIAHRVPLNHIASYLNMTPQSLSRIRKNLK